MLNKLRVIGLLAISFYMMSFLTEDNLTSKYNNLVQLNALNFPDYDLYLGQDSILVLQNPVPNAFTLGGDLNQYNIEILDSLEQHVQNIIPVGNEHTIDLTTLSPELLFIKATHVSNPLLEVQLIIYNPFENLNLPDSYFNYANIALPNHFLNNEFPGNFQFQRAAIELDNIPASNLITDAGATLGRVLFYDTNLSANGTTACASCHHQNHGFSDPAIQSVGFNGGLTRRHSMGLANARFYEDEKFFWDERAATLEDQVLEPFQDPIEMGLTLSELDSIVTAQQYYPPLFEDAFGDTDITTTRIAHALAQFVRSIVSISSRYDSARIAVTNPVTDFPGFTSQENEGKDLFYLRRTLSNGDVVNCARCHISEAFAGPISNNPNATSSATVNGLDSLSVTDFGVFESTGNNNDIGKFKVTSLRNIAVSAPYMHDGRFATLEEVIDHYSSGIQNHMNLRPPLRGSNGQANQFNFTQTEKDALIAFLNTLTDFEMMSDEKYSNPFTD